MSGAQITVFTKLPAVNDPNGTLLSKRIALVGDQVVSHGTPCRMARGVAEVVPTALAADLARIITAMRCENALALGCINGYAKAHVVTVGKLARLRVPTTSEGLPIIARTRDYIDYQDGPAWMLADFDKKGMPAAVAAAIGNAGGMWQALLSVVPALAQAARVTRASTSAGLARTDTGEALPGSGGEHHYILVADGSEIDRALTTLHDLCWLHGLGWYLIGSSGQLLDRSIIDCSVRFGERLCFEGPPEVLPPLVQDTAARTPVAHEGRAIETRVVIPSLTDYQLARVKEAKQRARLELGPRTAEIRAEADRRQAEAIANRTGVPFLAAMRTVAARHNGVLLPNIILDFDHLGLVSVEDVLAAPDCFIGETLADPLEGADYGRGKAMVLRSNPDLRQIFISSFAHGRAFYRLRHDARTTHAAISAADPKHVVALLCAIVGQAEIEADELVELVATAAAKSKIGIRAINARLKADRDRRRAAEHKATHDQSVAGDCRLTYPLPPPDGERTPIVRLVDETLAADASEEPPMRIAVGDIVEVRTVEPWGLHLLSSTGCNAAPSADGGYKGSAGDAEGLRAPPEPVIARLSPVAVELLIERYIRFEIEPTECKPGYAAALQRPFIDALMDLTAAESTMPVGRAISTAPLVAMNGKIIAGFGLDRCTGLIHRIEPQLYACLPAETPTEDDVREALRWLLDEWLVDVNADITGKLLVLMLCLSMVERVLLRARPAWFVTAGHRGGGKTTLVHMVTMAIFGRMAAAAAWSDNEEERRKALFSYLRQGVATLCWDNIPRGAQITSAAIEKALTSLEISDRVLGESEFETAPGGTVQIFTGDNIAAKGDMCSRSFRIVINVDRPDPENRDFVHPDPIEWTMQHRPQILRRLYTIMIYGCQNRPAGQVAKTRFKDWWSLCGWPVELAASLIGEIIDCIALLKASETDEDETSAASAMLSALKAQWGRSSFAAKDIIRIIEAGVPSLGIHADPFAKEKADRLMDAFGELLGRRLDRPTPGTIGKLLKNRLVDRPTFIDDSNVVATLKKFSEGHTNRYFVQILDIDSVNGTATSPGG
jgi:hypothetical protein